MFDGDCAYVADVQTPPCGLHPSREEIFVDRLRGVGPSAINYITLYIHTSAVINKVDNYYSIFAMTISSPIDRHAEAVTRLPGVRQIWILLDGADDSFAPDAHAGGFAAPPGEFPTIRFFPPLAKQQISSLIADSHGPSSGDCCT
jgi:hypothetical protein